MRLQFKNWLHPSYACQSAEPGVHMRVLGRDFQGESSRDFLGLWLLLIFACWRSLDPADIVSDCVLDIG